MKSLILVLICACFSSVSCWTLSECGKPPANLTAVSVTRDQYPFLASLYNTNDGKFFCSGTLITPNHILSAAHCFRHKFSTSQVSALDIITYVGRYDLTAVNDRYVYMSYPEELFIHENWNPNDPRYDADIAILRDDTAAPLRSNVYPACLWTSTSGIDTSNLFMVGYCSSEFLQNTPRQSSISLLSNDLCSSNDQISGILSSRTLCAGGSEANPCVSDSGTGIYAKSGDSYYVNGIVSASLLSDCCTCDYNNFEVYTSVGDFTNWIYKNIGYSTSLDCNYGATGMYYTCNAQSSSITSDNMVLANITGTHLPNRNNNQVSEVSYNNQNTVYLPLDIATFFPNLLSIYNRNSKVKYLKRQNFAGMGKVTKIDFSFNQIEVLPADVFAELVRLEYIYIFGNSIKDLHRDLFINNPRLNIVYIYQNQIEYLDGGLFRLNRNFEQLHIDNNKIQRVDSDFFNSIPNLERANFQSNTCVSSNYPLNLGYDDFIALVTYNCSTIY